MYVRVCIHVNLCHGLSDCEGQEAKRFAECPVTHACSELFLVCTRQTHANTERKQGTVKLYAVNKTVHNLNEHARGQNNQFRVLQHRRYPPTYPMPTSVT